MQTKNFFFTGATGFIGRNLIRRIILQDQYSKLFLLIRSRKNESADVRFFKYIARLATEVNIPERNLLDRIILVKGHLESAHLGIPEPTYKKLAAKITSVFHIAASVNLHDSLFNLRKTNVGGTSEILKFATLAHTKGGLDRLHYLSTAYIAGKRKGNIFENELDTGQDFVCNYERAKFEAELLVENQKPNLPITIYRPSMVVGDSETGATCAFNVIYEPLKMILKGRLPLWAANNNTKIDIVPVDYVCDALMHLASRSDETIGKTFHLTVGSGKEILSEDLLDTYIRFLTNDQQMYLPKPLVVAPLVMKGVGKLTQLFGGRKWKQVAKNWLTYADYTSYPKSFDNSETCKLLKSEGIRAPRLEEYLPVLFDYAFQHNFKPASSKTILKPAIRFSY